MIRQEGTQCNLYYGTTFVFDLLQDRIELLYENSDRTVSGKVTFDEWQIAALEENRCKLVAEKLLQDMNTVVKLSVTYVIRETVIEKKVTWYQNHALNLYIGMTQKIVHPESCGIWSFDALDERGSCIYGGLSEQAFPAAGLKLSGGQLFGVLLDTGIANG